jgi:demethylmenaquinone methyltransferase / 2-methoxy-6-polyprenyl-1,4-benzoquinol methylase
MSLEVQKLFNSIAPRYDLLNHVLSLRLDYQWRREAVRLLAGRSHVLDLCAGTLDLSIELHQISPDTTIDALDFSQEMLDQGELKLDVEQAKKITIHCADAEELPFDKRRFDGAMVAYGMRNIDDNERALAEIARVLRPGARLVVLEFFRPEQALLRLFHASYGRWVIPFLGGLISRNRAAYRYLRDSIQAYYSISEFANTMRQAGFQNIKHKKLWGGPSSIVCGELP